MGWRVWTGKYQEEIRYLRGLIDEIIVICEDEQQGYFGDWTTDSLSTEIIKVIDDTQDEYKGADKDEENGNN
jgi:hypothetical protein